MGKIKKILYLILNYIAKNMQRKAGHFSIAKTARVNYLGIVLNKESVLKVGDRSIMEGRISFDKSGSAVIIGKNTFIGASHIVCAEKVEIGDNVMIAWGCTIVDHNSHSLSAEQRAKDVSDWYKGEKDWSEVAMKSVKIEDGAWIGLNSIILKGVTIGEGAVVGAGSVVTKNVEPYTVVAGNPARFIKKIDIK